MYIYPGKKLLVFFTAVAFLLQEIYHYILIRIIEYTKLMTQVVSKQDISMLSAIITFSVYVKCIL